ncbi:MAG: hypothetical protein JWL90_1026 [Chthoniobacteraceae bacterium]|nr:hypothetical protein [Chthoniobacteraceae bacterium]
MQVRLYSRSIARTVRLWVIIGALYLVICSSLKAESFFDSRYQYYQEEDDRIRVDSNYSLFSIDLNETTVVDGSFLYSAISGASPTGLPPFKKGDPVPSVYLEDERYAFTLGLGRQIGSHAVKAGFAYSTESDYTSFGYSLQDTISFNHKNTELVLGFAFTDDTVGANGTSLDALKRSYDAIVGVNQVLSRNDLVSLNIGLGWKQGFLSDPYKRVLINEFYVFNEKRPDQKFEQLLFLQWTHYFSMLNTSMETSYRFGHNDYGSISHTAQVAFYKRFFGGRLTLRPSFRYYRQSKADFYDTEFTGNPDYYSSDYRVSAEETFNLGVQARLYIVKEKLAVDAGYERYITRGLDDRTSQSAYPDAHSFTVGLHFQF